MKFQQPLLGVTLFRAPEGFDWEVRFYARGSNYVLQGWGATRAIAWMAARRAVDDAPEWRT